LYNRNQLKKRNLAEKCLLLKGVNGLSIRAIFFDIDGTLLNRQSRMLSSTREAIAAAHEKGIIIAVATGRGPIYLIDEMKEYGLDYAVTYNGQYILSQTGEVLSAKPFDKTTIRELAMFGDEKNREMMFCGSKQLMGSTLLKAGNSNFVRLISPLFPKKLAGGLKSSFQNFVRRYRKPHYEKLSILREPVYQVVLISPEKETEKFRGKFPECTFTRSNPYSLDVIPKGGSKLKGIEQLAQMLDISLDEIMAFGDSWNDMDMLKGVGIGVAMGNGVSDVKAVADYVTSSNDKDGIAKAFKEFGILDDFQASGSDEVELEEGFQSADEKFNKVKEFHRTFDKEIQETPIAYSPKDAGFRAGFKVEELVEYLYAASDNDEKTFKKLVKNLHADIDKAEEKIEKKAMPTEDVLVGEVDALVDLLYFTYGSFVLMGVDPDKLFSIVHQANMGKLWSDGEAHYDPETHKILKPKNWEQDFAPESKIKEEILRQINERARE
jgi:Cof subfamily protein (haloacid dehalogenase superfamily)